MKTLSLVPSPLRRLASPRVEQFRIGINQGRTYFAQWRQHADVVSVASALRHYPQWHVSIRSGRSPLADSVPWITYDAIEFLRRVLKPGMRVFEYGMGGSTLFFLQHRCAVTSVEHHPEWYRIVAAAVAAHGFSEWRPILQQPDEVESKAGSESSLDDYRSEFMEYAGRTFHGYATSIECVPNASLDLVVVDGRARVACARQALAKVKLGGLLMLDNSERDRYKPIHEVLAGISWRPRHFFGPGPYVGHEFWGTSVWTRTG